MSTFTSVAPLFRRVGCPQSRSLPARLTRTLYQSGPRAASSSHMSSTASTPGLSSTFDARGSKQSTNVRRKRFEDFDLAGRIFVVTGGAQGLGLALAEGLVEAGGKGKFQ